MTRLLSIDVPFCCDILIIFPKSHTFITGVSLNYLIPGVITTYILNDMCEGEIPYIIMSNMAKRQIITVTAPGERCPAARYMLKVQEILYS